MYYTIPHYQNIEWKNHRGYEIFCGLNSETMPSHYKILNPFNFAVPR